MDYSGKQRMDFCWEFYYLDLIKKEIDKNKHFCAKTQLKNDDGNILCETKCVHLSVWQLAFLFSFTISIQTGSCSQERYNHRYYYCVTIYYVLEKKI